MSFVLYVCNGVSPRTSTLNCAFCTLYWISFSGDRAHAEREDRPRRVMAERPAPRATLPPLRERVWTVQTQRRLLQDALLGLTLYRKLVTHEEDAAFVEVLESEFDQLLEKVASLSDEGVYCLKFPAALPAPARFLIGKVAERYHLQTHTFGEDEKRFVAVYVHPRDAMAPPLRLADYAHASSYYAPPPPPAAQSRDQQRNKFQRRSDDSVDLEAEELPLSLADLSRWTSNKAYAEREEVGYECEIADCHRHLLELRCNGVAAPAAARERLEQLTTPEALAVVRPLPDGWLCVFRSEAHALAFVERYRAGEAAAPGEPTTLALPPCPPNVEAGDATSIGEMEQPLTCVARQLSALQRRGGGAGNGARGGAPRALQAALRGLGTGGAQSSSRSR